MGGRPKVSADMGTLLLASTSECQATPGNSAILRAEESSLENEADFPTNSPARELFAQITTHISNLEGARSRQVPARLDKAELLEELREDFKNIARTARAIQLDERGVGTPYKMPGQITLTSGLAHAGALLQQLEDGDDDSAEVKTAKAALRARFVAFDLPADFVADLREDYEALVEATRHNQSENQESVENTSRLEQILKAAARTVQKLDAIL